MIERAHRLWLRIGHPPPRVISQYIDDDLDLRERVGFEAHLRECARCRRELQSLRQAVNMLGTMGSDSTPGLADSVIVALRSDGFCQPGADTGSSPPELPALSVVSEATSLPVNNGPLAGRGNRARATLQFCLRRAQLRVTLPLAMLIGVALSFINQGNMLLRAPIDVSTWVMCGLNFLLPFVGLNIALLMVGHLARQAGAWPRFPPDRL